MENILEITIIEEIKIFDTCIKLVCVIIEILKNVTKKIFYIFSTYFNTIQNFCRPPTKKLKYTKGFIDNIILSIKFFVH